MIKENRVVLVVVTLMTCLLGQQSAHAQKGDKVKGGKNNNPPVWNSGVLTLAPFGSGQAVAGDPLGNVYDDGVDGVNCIEGDGGDTRPECHVPYRSVDIDLGLPLTTWGDAPFNGGFSGLSDPDGFAILGRSFRVDGVASWPAAGETLTTPGDGTGGVIVRFIVEGTHYYLNIDGAGITGTGYDDDADGVRDRVVVNVPPMTFATLNRLTVERKNKWRWVAAGEFAVPATQLVFHLAEGSTPLLFPSVLLPNWPDSKEPIIVYVRSLFDAQAPIQRTQSFR